MAAYFIRTRKPQEGAYWERGGMWILGSREDSHLVNLHMTSQNGGITYQGALTYSDGAQYTLKAQCKYGNVFSVHLNDGSKGDWTAEESWVIGGPGQRPIIALEATATGKDPALSGTLTFANGKLQDLQSTLAGLTQVR